MSEQKCADKDCENKFDPDHDDARYSERLNGWFCWGCYEAFSEGSSRLIHVRGYQDIQKWIVNDFEIVDAEYGEAPYRGDAEEFCDKIKREWKSSDGWRGHYETTIDGWSELVGGWTTGNWGDSTSDRKQLFNDWCEEVIEGEEFVPVPIAFAFDPTSNLFSTAVSVLVADKDRDTLKQYLSESVGLLADSLK